MAIKIEPDLTLREAARLLASDHMDAPQSRSRLYRWADAELIEPLGQDGDYRLDRARVAAAQVGFWLFDAVGLANLAGLREILRQLTAPDETGASPINRVLADIEAGGEPYLIVSRWRSRSQARFVSKVDIRLTPDHERPIVEPGGDWTFVADIVLELAPLLGKLTRDNVIPLRADEAVN